MIQNVFLLTISLIFFAITGSLGQEDLKWRSIAFTLEDGFEILQNDQNQFEATVDGLDLIVLPFVDDEIDEDDISDFTAHVAINMDLEAIDDAQEIELNDLEGAYVEGYKDGHRVFLLGMINPYSDDNFIAIVSFEDDDLDAEDEALGILNSFRAVD